MVKLVSTSRLRCDTSSLMPIEKLFLGWGFASSSKTVLTIAGVKSLDEMPYRPPITRGICARSPFATACPSVLITSRYSGSPDAPGSLVSSSTAIERTDDGSAVMKSAAEKGRYKRTCRWLVRMDLTRHRPQRKLLCRIG